LISAAYQPFIQAVGRVIGFEEAGIYYTPLKMDQYVIDISEKETLKDLADEITKMPPLTWNLPVKEITPITYRHRLKIIFEEEISNMQIGKILTEISARAGHEKVRAIIDSLEKTGNSAEGVIYLGHSVLDAAALEWVRDNGGMAVSFNADRAALQFAEVAVISDNSVILAILSDAFLQKGKEGVMELVKNWDINKIQKCKIPQPFINQLFSHESFPQLELVTDSNLERLIKESEYCRRTSFGETI
jgi:predicted HAD superfamily phosphohydrolase